MNFSLVVGLCLWVLSIGGSAKSLFRNSLFTDLDLEKSAPAAANSSAAILRGRIQIYGNEFDDVLYCLQRKESRGIYYLGAGVCGYEDSHLFEYDTSHKTLRSQGVSDKVWSFDLIQAMDALQDIPGARTGMLFTMVQQSLSEYTWQLPLSKFDNMVAQHLDPLGNKFCVEVSELNLQLVAFPHLGITPQCAQLKFMTPQEDYVTGSIKYYSSSGKPSSCVQYNAHAVPPQSALSLAPCQPKRTDQVFMYNMITRHLRAFVSASSNPEAAPALFFWWKGPVKSYSTLPPHINQYGWRIPLLESGPVTVWDSRGYSGYCWGGQGQEIHVGQSCSSFAFLPIKQNLFVSHLKKAAGNTQAVVLQEISEHHYPDEGPYCLRSVRGSTNYLLDETDAGAGSMMNRYYRLQITTCPTTRYRLSTRFVISQPHGASCTQQQCLGLLRWAGDYEHVLFVPHVSQQMVGAFQSEDDVEVEMDIPFNRVGPLLITHKYTKRVLGCVGRRYDENNLFVVPLGHCIQFKALSALSMPPDEEDPDVFTIARFDMNSVLYLSKVKEANKMKNSVRAEWARQVTHATYQERRNFYNTFDPFFADLGDLGNRRFRGAGTGFNVRAQGDIVANEKEGDTPNGIMFRLLPSRHFMLHKYTVMSLYFSTIRKDLQPDDTFVLMSFARNSGCVVFVTGSGHIGLKCYHKKQELFTSQVSEWPLPSFSLTRGVHKVALLFSNQQGAHIRLFVDGVQLFAYRNVVTWPLEECARTVKIFYDSYFWQYKSFPGALKRFSAVVGNDYHKVLHVATRFSLQHADLETLPGYHSDLTTVSGLETEWSNCSVIMGDQPNMVEGVSCQVSTYQTHRPVVVSRDLLRLACSRPSCQIYFDDDTPEVGSSFRVVYEPNYPASFVSENVGSPDRFEDPAFVSDGWSRRVLAFVIKYVPFTPTATPSSTPTHVHAAPPPPSRLEVTHQVVVIYTRVESRFGDNADRNLPPAPSETSF